MQVCFIFYIYLFLNNFISDISVSCFIGREGEWTFLHWCILRKLWGYMYARCLSSVDMDMSLDIHGKSVDMNMDMNGKFHIHGTPAYRALVCFIARGPILSSWVVWLVSASHVWIGHKSEITCKKSRAKTQNNATEKWYKMHITVPSVLLVSQCTINNFRCFIWDYLCLRYQ